jgi:hypothetical protein
MSVSTAEPLSARFARFSAHFYRQQKHRQHAKYFSLFPVLMRRFIVSLAL